jgi:hypothetical protein
MLWVIALLAVVLGYNLVVNEYFWRRTNDALMRLIATAYLVPLFLANSSAVLLYYQGVLPSLATAGILCGIMGVSGGFIGAAYIVRAHRRGTPFTW